MRKVDQILEKKAVILLGIESSCDDTSMAVLVDGKVASNVTYNQTIHAKYGGVIPEWASRKHMEAVVPVMEEALLTAKCSLQDLDGIAVTRGPGLMGSLVVGLCFAKGLSYSLDIPLMVVNHLEAHVLSLLIEEPKPEFPFLCLTVSGGHTQLVIVRDYDRLEVIGHTLDDAAGEAFDKTGKLLGLGYPAGPEMDKLARIGKPIFKFPISKMKGLDYSFSGLKTSVLYFLKDRLKEDPHFITDHLNDLCASIQYTIVEILCHQLVKASEQNGIKRIGIAGGVSANSGLREKLHALAQKHSWEVFMPKMEYCTDNAAMIAMGGFQKWKKGLFAEDDIEPLARMPIGT
ncbi:MAG TPA: tRNA (adenosine(37)-N6)-threonylcarbamoyltransferase complex transferase subunit TsaD [Saprospiraceae bacterium]|nr:tRNA (adenosine(37)-N6)-threonylcarbamoyltransferase complex transferase subunit TsaD [Saprospiraceae bacterium]